MNKTEKEHLRQVLNNKFGPGAKFLAQFLIETEKINEKAIKAGYKEKRQEFEALCNEYKTQLEASSSLSNTPKVESKETDLSPIVNKPTKKNPEIALYEKFKTPLANKTNGIILKQSNLAELLNEDEASQEQPNKNRKRSALMAEISVLHDENSSAHEDDEQDDRELKKSLFKGEAEAKAKKTKTKKGKSKKQDNDNNHDDELNISSSSNAKKISKNPSKKAKTNEASEDEEEKPAKKGSKKKKNTKASSDMEGDQEEVNKKTKKTKKGKKTKASDTETNDKLVSEPKTPGVQDAQKRKSRLELLQSTVKKTIKKRPMTRRAAAAAAAAEAKTKEPSSNLKAPSTLKKINKFEFSVAKAAAPTTSESTAKTPLIHRNKVINNLVLTASKIKPNFRTSIDERKARTSQAKLEAKRKSVKKAQAILKSIHNERKLSATYVANSTKLNNILTDDEEEEVKEEVRIKPSRMSTEKEKEIIENILKSVSPKIVVQKIPTSMLNSNGISASKITAFNENQKRLTKDLMSSATIQQNYRVLQPMSKITTPAKTNPPSSASAATNQNRNSFIKFLERNTPSKLTRVEQEERQKAELALKESKEKERLALLEKQKQQQLEDKKKKREEKMKKINELKLKTQLELEKKQREQQLQMTATKPTTSSSCLNLNQLSKNNTTNTSQIPSSSSSSSLATLNKKPVVATAPPTKSAFTMEQSDLSTFSTELSNFKQINEHLKKGSLAFASTNTDTADYHKENQKNMCETTYVLNSPSKQVNALGNKSVFTNYQVTPLQPPKLKNQDNYDVSDLRSEDETDDDEEPSKPVPDWARDPKLVEKVKRQAFSMFNFTRLYKAASQSEIILEDIFKIRRKKFNERSSSANWNSSPIWKGNGINGEESFWQFKKHY